MKDEDPFMDLLQDALGLPDDLELGADVRRSLMAAAAAAETPDAGNIVSFQPARTLERQGFDWLLGECEGGRELFAGLAASPALLSTLDAERHFLNTLRRSLRQPVEETRRVVRRRPLAAGAAAVAALLAVVAVPLWKSSHATASATVAATSSVPSASGLKRLPQPQRSTPFVPVNAGQAQPAVAMASSAPAPAQELPAANPPPRPFALALAALPAEPKPGDRCSVAASDLSLPVSLDTSRLAALDPAETPDFEPGRSETPGKASLAMNEDRGTGYLTGMGLDMRLASQAFYTGKDDSNPGINEPSIPETGGAIPVMLGFMVLLMHRFRRRLPGVQVPLRS